MKRRRFISFVFILILCFGMIGCGKEKKIIESDKFHSDYMEIKGGTTTEEGYFDVINGLSYYVDFETMNAVPICNKPNCRHLSWREDRETKCNAADTSILKMFPYEDKLYSIRGDSEGGSELFVSNLDGSNQKTKGRFLEEDEVFAEGVLIKNQLFFVKEVYLKPDAMSAESKVEMAMCVLDLNTMKIKELRRTAGIFSMELLGGTEEYQIYFEKEENQIKCYRLDYKDSKSQQIILENEPQDVVAASETGFYYSSGIDFSKEVYRYDFETGKSEIYISEDEVRSVLRGDYQILDLWDVRGKDILFFVWDGIKGELFIKETESGEIRNLFVSSSLPEGAILDSLLFRDEEGVGFSYIKRLESDQIQWYGYITWEDMLNGENNIKVFIEPKLTDLGYPLDEKE